MITLNRKPILLPTVLLFFLLLFAIAFGVSNYYGNDISIPNNSGGIYLTQDHQLLVANATIIEIVSGHAWLSHGTEVNSAMKCLNDNGSSMSFKTFGFTDDRGKPLFTNLWLCQQGDDWYAIVTTTLEKMGGNRIGRLITAYKIDRTLFPTIGEFILKIKDIWRAVEITFKIEAGSIFLSPK